ncbi:MAG: hypothetical protein KatS3mg110_1013 [Pirellulaceae bacterium]|nr:MAG: hypothetical protein KatS3mg110_1013 [Pirellulaceae bacterium]
MERRAAQRRRRVLLERDATGPKSSDSPISADVAPTAFGPAHTLQYAHPNRGARVGSLLPVTRCSVLAIGTGPALLIGLLVAGHFYLASSAIDLPPTALELFDPTKPASLVQTGITLLWWALSLLAWLVLQVRKNKADDYRGTYRRWGWLAAAAMLVAVARMCPLGVAGVELLAHLTGWATNRTHYWMLALSMPLAVGLAVWYLLEVRSSRASLLLAIAAATVWVLRGLGLSGELSLDASWAKAALWIACQAGPLCLLWLSLLVYGRHAVQQMEGPAPFVRRTAAATRNNHAPTGQPTEETANQEDGRETNRPPLAATIRRTTNDRSSTETQPEGAPAATEGEADSSAQRPLSRAERRRLKRWERKRAA